MALIICFIVSSAPKYCSLTVCTSGFMLMVSLLNSHLPSITTSITPSVSSSDIESATLPLPPSSRESNRLISSVITIRQRPYICSSFCTTCAFDVTATRSIMAAAAMRLSFFMSMVIVYSYLLISTDAFPIVPRNWSGYITARLRVEKYLLSCSGIRWK